ncbi:hypothetical protein [Actinoplanes sp. NPDC049265]|uniref:hypothetical protein n=1 Tax=Actinoplanes sp. NPDC049265 TaxID=3363902 RepID=UPI003720EEBC
MAAAPHARDRAERRRLRRGLVLHELAIVVFGLLAWQGIDAIRADVGAMGVPMLIAGAAGLAGALAIVVPALRWRHLGDPPRWFTPARVQRAARIGMGLAAVAAVVAGVALAPRGLERGFVITVNAVVGGLLALFALLAGERPRPRG